MSVTDLARRAADRAGEMMAAGVARSEILEMLVKSAEVVAGEGAVCSILVLDRDGLLRNGASPNLLRTIWWRSIDSSRMLA